MYQLKDGSPRYGIRTEHHDQALQQDTLPRGGSPETIAREASQLGLHHLAAGAEHRLTQSWADEDDALLVSLRNENPLELAVAEKIVNEKLGSTKQWLHKARTIYSRRLAPAAARRQTAGMLAKALFLRLFLIVLLIGPAVLAVSVNVPLLVLVLIGVASILAAMYLGGVVTEWLRLPVHPPVRAGWVKELRRDVVDATLLAVLQNRRAAVDRQTATAAARGWKHLSFVAGQLDRMDQGPAL